MLKGILRAFRQREAWRRAPFFSLFIMLILAVVVALGDLLAPHSAYQGSLPLKFIPPFWVEGGSLNYLLGTDYMGRDILSRIIIGARYSLSIAVFSLFVGGILGGGLGIISGYFGGWVDKVIMRLADATLSFPIILLVIILVATQGPSLSNIILALALVFWARIARVIRGEVLSVKRRDFVSLAHVAGCSGTRIMLRHIFPNVVNTLVVLLTLQLGWVIIIAASISYLGAGIPPPTPEWGVLVADGREYLATAWWISLFPGLAILLVSVAFNLFGDWLRDAIDPKLRQI